VRPGAELQAISPTALRFAVWVWLAFLIAGSVQPVRPDFVKTNHRLTHYVAFAGAAVLLLWVSPSRRQEILRAGFAFLLGLSLELAQHLLYRNPVEWRDIVDDALAVLLVFTLHRLAGARKPAPSPTE